MKERLLVVDSDGFVTVTLTKATEAIIFGDELRFVMSSPIAEMLGGLLRKESVMLGNSRTISIRPPDAKLGSNARGVHYLTLARLRRNYRDLAWGMAAAVGAPDEPWSAMRVDLHFFMETKRRRDRDNLIGMMKSAIDGLADAGWVVNDSEVWWGKITQEKAIKGIIPHVVIRCTELIAA